MANPLRQHMIATMNNVLCSLKADIAESGRCCELKAIDFSSGNPDYSVVPLQKVYLIRYYGGYLCEYRFILGQALEWLGDLPPHVLSMGCGACIDARSLHFELLSRGKTNVGASYSGVDVVDWHWKDFDNICYSPAKFYHGDVAGIPEGAYPHNVLFFPKSLSDIPEEALSTMIEKLGRCLFQSNRLVVVSSIRESLPNRVADAGRFSRICRVFLDKGYSTEDEPEKSHHYPGGQGVAWSTIYRGYTVPDAVVNFANTLDEECPNRRKNGAACKPECSAQLRRSPIFKTGTMTFNMARFQK